MLQIEPRKHVLDSGRSYGSDPATRRVRYRSYKIGNQPALEYLDHDEVGTDHLCNRGVKTCRKHTTIAVERTGKGAIVVQSLNLSRTGRMPKNRRKENSG